MNHKYHDLARLAREDPTFQAEMGKLLDRFEGATGKERDEAMWAVIEASGYNTGFLLPWNFPHFGGPGKGMSLLSRPYSFPLFSMALGGYIVIRGSRQFGKCRVVGSDEPVSAVNGRPLLPADLQVGTAVVGVDERDRTLQTHLVRHIHDAGTLSCRRLHLRSGAVLDLTDGHKLLTPSGWVETKDLKTGDFVANVRQCGVFTGTSSPSQERIQLTALVIGDGCTKPAVGFGFTSACDKLMDLFIAICEPKQKQPIRRYRKTRNGKPGKAWDLRGNRDNSVFSWLREDDLIDKYAWEKHMPSWVFDLSREDTITFLNHLWATDGHVGVCKKTMHIEFYSSSKMLVREVRALLWKFDIPCMVTSRRTGYRKKGKRSECRPSYAVRVETVEGWQRFCQTFNVPGKECSGVPDRILDVAGNNNKDVLPGFFRGLMKVALAEASTARQLSFKSYARDTQRRCNPANSVTRSKIRHMLQYIADNGKPGPAWLELKQAIDGPLTWTSVKKIQQLGPLPAWDIEVDGRHNYILDGVVSHNSTSLSARGLTMQGLMQPWTTAYIAPHPKHVDTFATKYREMERAYRYSTKHKGLRNNLEFKEYPNGGRFEMFSVLSTADHVRGKTFDELDFDEYQMFDIRLEADISQTQRVSKTPVNIYSGTSTTVDSPLEVRFQQSSGGVWMMRSRSDDPDKKFINCSDPELVLKMLQEEGLTCPYTGKRIYDPLEGGIFEHERPGLMDDNVVGLHIPQFIIPEFLEPVEWAKLMKFRRDYGDTKTLQEVCGIPVEEGHRELTQKDLQEMCCLPFKNSDEIKKYAKEKNPYRFIVSGCDWGGSDYQMARQAKTSYTVHVMLGIKGDGTMDVLHMKRYSGMDYDEIASLILRDHIAMGGTAIGSDYGAGYAYNTFLHRDMRVDPTRHFIWEYQAPYTAIVKKPQFQQFPTHYMLNKTESITQIFEAFKKQRIRCYGWEAAEGCLKDCLNSFRIHAENRFGRQYFLMIRNPANADDTLHALNFAYVVGRILLREPMFDDVALQQYARQQSGVGTRTHFSSLVVKG